MTWIGITILISLGILHYAAPYLTRRDLLFGVTVAPDFRESAAARNIFRRFWRVCLLFNVPAILIANATPIDRTTCGEAALCHLVQM